jgi:hypothetical protein
VQRIVQKAVARMSDVYGTEPAGLRAQIGPGIGLDSFEVGHEVYAAFAASGFDMAAISRQYPSHSDAGQRRWHIDLPQCNRQQLCETGVMPQNIGVTPVCTYQQYEAFFSARRLGLCSGRIFTGILLRF